MLSPLPGAAARHRLGSMRQSRGNATGKCCRLRGKSSSGSQIHGLTRGIDDRQSAHGELADDLARGPDAALQRPDRRAVQADVRIAAKMHQEVPVGGLDHPVRERHRQHREAQPEQVAQVIFGSPEQVWEVVDDGAPRAMVVPIDARGEPLYVDGDILPLPSQENPSLHARRLDAQLPVFAHQITARSRCSVNPSPGAAAARPA